MSGRSNSLANRRDLKVTATLVFGASAISILLALLNYPVIGHDAYVHLNWLYQFPRILADGTWYPRWLSGSFGGFGAPTFYFYAPLVYWVASIFYLFGINSPPALYQIDVLVFALFSFVTVYCLLRNYRREKFPAFIAALVFSFLAYRFCDVYIRDALTEHAALAFLPLLFFRFPDKLRSIAVYSLGWTGLFLTNLPTAYLAVLSIFIIIIARRSLHEAAAHSISFLIAVAIAAIYLFPAFALRGLIHQRHLFDLPMRTSPFGFALLDLFQGHFDWLRILSTGTLVAGLLLIIPPLLKKDGDGGGSREWHWLIAVAIFFQIPFITAPFWHLVPGMPFVQFSWRWDGILLFAIVVVCSSAGSTPQESVVPPMGTSKQIGEGTAPLQRCILIGLAIVTLVSEATISRNLFSRPVLPLNSYLLDAPEYATKWAASDPSELIGITLRRMNDAPAVLLGLTLPGDSISLRSQTPAEWKFTAGLTRPTAVRFHQWYWPYWKAVADTTELVIQPDPNGFATAQLPAGNYSVTLKLLKSPVEITSGWVSAMGAMVLVLVFILAGYRWITTRSEITEPPALTRKI